MRLGRALVPLALALAVTGDAFAAPFGDVHLKDGRKWEGVTYDIKGNVIRVKFKNGSETEISMNDVLRAEPRAAEEAGDGEEAAEAAAPSPVDLASRCRLEPLAGWAPQATSSPLVRIHLAHTERDATLSVYIRRAAADLPADLTRLPKDVSDDIAADFGTRYSRAAGQKYTGTTLFGAPALKIESEVVEFGKKDKDKRKVTELRFRRFGLEYAISYSVAPADEGALAHQVGQLFESFSFLPAISSSPDSYADYGRGFRLDRPNAEWQLLTAPFDEENPARLITSGGKPGAPDRAMVTVVCTSGVAADAVLQDHFKKRKSNNRNFVPPTLEESKQGGGKVFRFKYEDFNPGENKKKLFKGFAGFVRGKVVVVTGISPVTDEDAAKLEGDIDAALAAVILFDEEALKDEVQTAQNAMLLVKQGSDASNAKRYDEAVSKFDEALRLAPTFARAIYLRGLAKKEKQDFDGSKVDFEAAAALDPSAGYDAELSTIYEAEAAAAERAKNWGEAVRLWQRVWRADRTEDKRRRLLQAAGQHWAELKKKDFARGLATLERDLNGVRTDEQVAEFLSRSYREGAALLLRDKEFGTARRWATKAKSAAPSKPSKDEADKLLDQISQAERKPR